MDWLAEQAQRQGDKPFLNGLTFGQAHEEVDHMASRLWASLGSCQRVAIWAHNSLPMALLLLALLRLQKEVVFLNVHLQVEELIGQTEDLAIDALILADSLVDKGASIGNRVSFPVYAVDDLLAVQAVSAPSLARPSEQAIAVIMNTSATTGKFKSVPLRWGQIRAHVVASKEVLGCQEDDNWLMVLPLFHVSGFSILMRSLYNGTAVTIHDKYQEEAVLDAINSGNINMVSLVPTLLKQLAPKIGSQHRLRLILLGGEYIPEQLVEEAIQRQLPVYKTYGMTETFSQCVTFSLLDHMDKKHSVGRPLPGMSVTIGHPDAEGVGEVYIEGPMLMTGYLGREPLEGPFNTDDIGYMDQDGYLYILNRRKDLIISGGENIYPKEIEDMLYALPFVRECALVPVADETWGQVPALFMAIDQEAWQTYTGSSLSLFQEGLDFKSSRTDSMIISYVDGYLSERLAKYKVPKYYRLLPELPRNGTGKILRKDLTV